MRKLLPAVGLLFAMGASAQNKPDNPLSFELTAPSAGLKMITPQPKQPVYSHTLPSGAKVYSLPQDNMPCVVPLVSSTMPVIPGAVIKPGQPGSIPNAGYGPIMITQGPKAKMPLLKKP